MELIPVQGWPGVDASTQHLGAANPMGPCPENHRRSYVAGQTQGLAQQLLPALQGTARSTLDALKARPAAKHGAATDKAGLRVSMQMCTMAGQGHETRRRGKGTEQRGKPSPQERVPSRTIDFIACSS